MLKTLLIGIVTLITGWLIYLTVKPSSKKYYTKARRAHKIGEKCYHVYNDPGLAEEYYKDAEEFRSKARTLEQ